MRHLRASGRPHERTSGHGDDGFRPGPAGYGWLTALAVYREPRLRIIFLMGFASGLPLALTGATLAIWLTELRMSLTSIGLFAMLGVPYNVKFVWAPLFDRVPIPMLTRLLGRRRSWLLVVQIGLAGAIMALGATRPEKAPIWTVLAALAVAFLSASQDVIIDAYRIETAGEHEQGAAAAMTQYGYRLGMLASGAGALFLASVLPWSRVYAAMAGLLAVGLVTTLLAPEPRAAAMATPSAELPGCLRDAIVTPFVEFLRRQGVAVAVVVLAFIVLYTLGDAFAGSMANPFYLTIGFSKVEIATVIKTFGLGATLTGVFLGGLAVGRYGVMKALLVCGICQALSNLMFATQALAGHDVRVLVCTVTIENLTGGMASAALIAYLAVLCNVTYAATQYAFFTSFMAFGRTVLASTGGWVADHTTWVDFFAMSTLLAVPGLAILGWMMHRFPTASASCIPAVDPTST
ncbi:MAG: AmpG family muropeptide MFS transporter [Pseudonocardiaceae bacterium]